MDDVMKSLQEKLAIAKLAIEKKKLGGVLLSPEESKELGIMIPEGTQKEVGFSDFVKLMGM